MSNDPRCKLCDDEFDPERAELGYDICLECSEQATQRYLGRRLEKCEGIEIFRTDLKFVKSVLSHEQRRGFGVNVQVSSPAYQQSREERGDE